MHISKMKVGVIQGKLYICLLLSIFFISIDFEALAAPQWPESNLPVQLEFDQPDRIVAGETFDLAITLNKVNNYNYPGKLSLEFTGGMTPEAGTISNMESIVHNTTLELSWEKLSESNIIPFPVSVQTAEHMGGVYPVKVNYADMSGLHFSRNIGIYIRGNTQPEPYDPPLVENPLTIKLVYPDEVYYEESYALDIVIAKGKNTGAANVFVQLPPGSELTVKEYTNFHYRNETGDLSISLAHMPASPEFTIHCQVKNTSRVTSVYPIRASAEFADTNRISFSDFILITNKKTHPASYSNQGTLRSINAVVNADTASLFEELDRLLTKWRASTSSYQEATATSQPDNQQKNATKEFDIESIFTEDVIFYSIQIAASEVVLNNVEQKLQEKGFDEKILEDYDGSIYRYSVGDFESITEARLLKQKLVGQGYPDAFIVEYINGVRSRSFY